MFLVLVIVVVGVAVVGLGALGIGPLVLGDDRRQTRSGTWSIPVMVLVAGGGLLVLVLAAGVIGLGREAEVASPPDDEEEVVEETAPTTTAKPRAPRAPRVAPTSGALGPAVFLEATDPDAGAAAGVAAHVIGSLTPDTVLQVRVVGFPSFAEARIKQCSVGVCANFVGVQFGDAGTASFQYLVVDDFAPQASDGCRLDDAPCSIVVENIDGEGTAELGTLFTDEVPDAGHLVVEPHRGLVEGAATTVTVDGFLPDTELAVVYCVSETRTCENLDRPIVVDGTGGGAASVRVPSCPRRSQCSIAVRSTQSFARSTPVGLSFAAPAGAAYDPGRLALGIALAALLFGAAVVLVRRTDWSPVGEERAPEIDDAEYADLDAIIALMPPEEDEEDEPART